MNLVLSDKVEIVVEPPKKSDREYEFKILDWEIRIGGKVDTVGSFYKDQSINDGAEQLMGWLSLLGLFSDEQIREHMPAIFEFLDDFAQKYRRQFRFPKIRHLAD